MGAGGPGGGRTRGRGITGEGGLQQAGNTHTVITPRRAYLMPKGPAQ